MRLSAIGRSRARWHGLGARLIEDVLRGSIQALKLLFRALDFHPDALACLIHTVELLLRLSDMRSGVEYGLLLDNPLADKEDEDESHYYQKGDDLTLKHIHDGPIDIGRGC